MKKEQAKLLKPGGKNRLTKGLLSGFLAIVVVSLSGLSLPAYGVGYFVNAGNGPGIAGWSDTGTKSFELSRALTIKDVRDREKQKQAQQDYYSSAGGAGSGSGGLQGEQSGGGGDTNLGYGMDGGVGYIQADYVGLGSGGNGTSGGGGGGSYIRTEDGGIAYVPYTSMQHTYVGQVVNVTGGADRNSSVVINTGQESVGNHSLASSAPSYTAVSQNSN